MEYEDIDPNIRRSVESDSYPVEKTWRIKEHETHAKFQELQDRLENLSGRYSDQATFDFMLSLALQKVDDLEAARSEVQEAAQS